MTFNTQEMADFLRDADMQDKIPASASTQEYDNSDDDFPYPAF